MNDTSTEVDFRRCVSLLAKSKTSRPKGHPFSSVAKSDRKPFDLKPRAAPAYTHPFKPKAKPKERMITIDLGYQFKGYMCDTPMRGLHANPEKWSSVDPGANGFWLDFGDEGRLKSWATASAISMLLATLIVWGIS